MCMHQIYLVVFYNSSYIFQHTKNIKASSVVEVGNFYISINYACEVR